MKNVLLYSTDFSMCLSLLMYLQNNFNITTTTDLSVLGNLAKMQGFDIIIMDAEPNKKIEIFCENLRANNAEIPLIFTYVYHNNTKDFDVSIRKFANSIFYKPFDINEVSKKVAALAV